MFQQPMLGHILTIRNKKSKKWINLRKGFQSGKQKMIDQEDLINILHDKYRENSRAIIPFGFIAIKFFIIVTRGVLQNKPAFICQQFVLKNFQRKLINVS